METKIPIPSTATDITPSWIKQITGDTCLPDSISIQGNIQEGFGFLSTMFRVAYKTETENHSIIVKLLPKDQRSLGYTLSDSADLREIQFYSIVVPDLIEVVPSLQEHVCKYYHGQVQPAIPELDIPRQSILVMEDLKLKGFQMMEFSGDSSEKNIHGLIKCTAKIHFAASAVAVKKDKSLPELYPFLQGLEVNLAWRKEIYSLAVNGYPILEKYLKAENLEHVWHKYKELEPHLEEIVEILDKKGRNNPSLIHTDIWPPNIMVHDTLPVKIIDWQLLGYRDATFELSYMLFTVLTNENSHKSNVKKLLKLYWQEYEQLCQSEPIYNENIKRRGWEELEEDFFTWGCAFAFIWIVGGFAFGIDLEQKRVSNLFRILCEEVNVPDFLLRILNESKEDSLTPT